MVYIAVFIEHPTPFLREYFNKILNLTYPKTRLAMFIHNQVRQQMESQERTTFLSFALRSIIIRISPRSSWRNSSKKVTSSWNISTSMTISPKVKPVNKRCKFSTLFPSRSSLFHARFRAECQEDRCDYLFAIDSVTQIDYPKTLIELVALNRSVVAPMLVRPEKTWSNFWGDLNDDGFYQRSPDYMDIINYQKRFVCLYEFP